MQSCCFLFCFFKLLWRNLQLNISLSFWLLLHSSLIFRLMASLSHPVLFHFPANQQHQIKKKKRHIVAAPMNMQNYPSHIICRLDNAASGWIRYWYTPAFSRTSASSCCNLRQHHLLAGGTNRDAVYLVMNP